MFYYRILWLGGETICFTIGSYGWGAEAICFIIGSYGFKIAPSRPPGAQNQPMDGSRPRGFKIAPRKPPAPGGLKNATQEVRRSAKSLPGGIQPQGIQNRSQKHPRSSTSILGGVQSQAVQNRSQDALISLSLTLISLVSLIISSLTAGQS